MKKKGEKKNPKKCESSERRKWDFSLSMPIQLCKNKTNSSDNKIKINKVVNIIYL